MNQDARHRLTIESLRNLSFTLDTWDRRGFVSSNGAGKTTLLSIMVGIYEPVAGRIGIDGAVTSIAGPGSGTNFELTGNGNIRPRALFSGYSDAQIKGL